MSILSASLPSRRLFGFPIHAATMQQAVALCERTIARREHLTVGVVNVAKIVNMTRDPKLAEAVLSSDLVLADGIGVVWASRLLRAPLPERVAGIDLFENLLAMADRRGFSVYFLGATQEVLDEVLHRVLAAYPGLSIAGSRNGYFNDDEAETVAEDITRARPQILFVGITSPKKEIFLARWGHRIDVAVCHGVGGSFDILAGKVRRAPRSWQRWGLGWLYRVLQEPRRMWWRYLTTNTAFLGLLIRELWARRAGGAR